MKNNLHDLTKEDWNSLFPIELVEHNPNWKDIYEQERQRILEAEGSDIIARIEHFGSTAIPDIKAKPYIDIMIEISEELLFTDGVIKNFQKLGYAYFKVPKRENIAAYMSFGKGYNLNGEKEQIYHIHLCSKENEMWKQIYFRDYLISNADRAKAYEKLKIDLASKFKNDRGGYVLSKSDFINDTMNIMREKLVSNKR